MQHHQFRVHVQGTVTVALLAALRIRVLTPADLNAMNVTVETALASRAWLGGHGDGDLGRFARPLTVANEARVRFGLALQCEKALRRLEVGTRTPMLNKLDKPTGPAYKPSTRHRTAVWKAQMRQLLRACVLQSFHSLQETYKESLKSYGQFMAPQAVMQWAAQSQAWRRAWQIWWDSHRQP